MEIPSTNNFVLQGGGSEFSHKQKTLFNELLQAEKKYNKDQTLTVNYSDYNANRSDCLESTGKYKYNKTRQFRGKESIFKHKQPSFLFRRDNTIPDYHKNPHKWTKYSLEDVKNNDMTDNSNTNVALSLLKVLQARKSQREEHARMQMSIDDHHESDGAASSNSTKSVVFKKPFPKSNESKQVTMSTDDKSSVFRGSKVVLPEYVVGERPIINKLKRSRKTQATADDCKQIKLDHLKSFEEDNNNTSLICLSYLYN